MSSLANRRIALGAGALLLLGLAAPLSAQQPAKQQADTSCAVPTSGQIAMRDTAMHHPDTTVGRKYDSVPKPAYEKAGDKVAQPTQECRNQTQSGVTDSAGKSTLGPGVKKATPDQNEPVMSKGDTLKPGYGQPAK
jgi:hypothetical protein